MNKKITIRKGQWRGPGVPGGHLVTLSFEGRRLMGRRLMVRGWGQWRKYRIRGQTVKQEHKSARLSWDSDELSLGLFFQDRRRRGRGG